MGLCIHPPPLSYRAAEAVRLRGLLHGGAVPMPAALLLLLVVAVVAGRVPLLLMIHASDAWGERVNVLQEGLDAERRRWRGRWRRDGTGEGVTGEGQSSNAQTSGAGRTERHR